MACLQSIWPGYQNPHGLPTEYKFSDKTRQGQVWQLESPISRSCTIFFFLFFFRGSCTRPNTAYIYIFLQNAYFSPYKVRLAREKHLCNNLRRQARHSLIFFKLKREAWRRLTPHAALSMTMQPAALIPSLHRHDHEVQGKRLVLFLTK